MQQKLGGYLCCKPDHTGEKLSYFCYDEQCEQKGLICALCLFQFHKGHTSEPLKSLLHQIERDQVEASNNIQLFAKIDQSKISLKEVVEEIKDENLRNLLTVSIDMHYKNIQGQCENEFEKTIKVEKREQIETTLLNYKKRFSAFDEDPDKTKSNQEKLLHSYIKDSQEKRDVFSEAIKKGKVDYSLLNQFDFNEGTSNKKFHFSSSFIHSGLTFINDSKIKMNGYTDDYNYLVLCEPPLSPTKIQKITFKMVNLSCYITVGISIKSKVEGNYQFIQNGLGHGCYQMSYDGYSWSDTDSGINNHYNTWYFNQNDQVTVEFNPKQKMVKFVKNGDVDHGFSMGYTIDKKEKVHFSVSFNSEPEQVDIVY